MQKNKIDVVKAVCNSAARKLAVLSLAVAVSGGAVASAQEDGFFKEFETKNGKVASVKYNHTKNLLRIRGDMRIAVGDEYDEENLEGRTSIYRPGVIRPFAPARIEIPHYAEPVQVSLENGTNFNIESYAEYTLKNLLDSMRPKQVATAAAVCRDYLDWVERSWKQLHSHREEREVREEREIREETNATTTSQNAGYFGGMLNPFNWGFFGGKK